MHSPDINHRGIEVIVIQEGNCVRRYFGCPVLGCIQYLNHRQLIEMIEV
jgi:hypothetical protein